MEVIVIGGGQAGVAVSQRLAARDVEHLVLERGSIADTWRTRRWDAFRMVSPNWANALPGQPLAGPGDEFATAERFAAELTRFVRTNDLPVCEHTPAVSARRERTGFVVETPDATHRAAALVVASGFQWYPKTPSMAARLGDGILSLHTSRYRRPEALPPGAVLVVGGAQSGLQIALELARAGRRVLLCTSRVRRLPRRYRGRDMFAWWEAMGFLEHRTAELPDPSVVNLAQPVLAGGGSLSLQLLAREGVTLLGRLERIDGDGLHLADDRDANLAYGDESAAVFRRQVDEFVGSSASDPDAADEPVTLPPAPRELSLAGIGTVIWATGYQPHHPWLSVPFDAPGLHVIGRPWLIRRTSGTLYGIPKDALTVANAIADELRAARRSERHEPSAHHR